MANVLSSCRSCSEVRYGEREHARVTSHVTKKRMTLCGVCRGTGSDVPGGLWSTTKVPAGVVKRKREYVGLQVADTGCRAEGAGGAKIQRNLQTARARTEADYRTVSLLFARLSQPPPPRLPSLYGFTDSSPAHVAGRTSRQLRHTRRSLRPRARPIAALAARRPDASPWRR